MLFYLHTHKICASPLYRITVYMLGANLLESLFVLSFNHQNPQLGLIALTVLYLCRRSVIRGLRLKIDMGRWWSLDHDLMDDVVYQFGSREDLIQALYFRSSGRSQPITLLCLHILKQILRPSPINPPSITMQRTMLLGPKICS